MPVILNLRVELLTSVCPRDLHRKLPILIFDSDVQGYVLQDAILFGSMVAVTAPIQTELDHVKTIHCDLVKKSWVIQQLKYGYGYCLGYDGYNCIDQVIFAKPSMKSGS